MIGWNAPLSTAYRRLAHADNDAGLAFYDAHGKAETVGFGAIADDALRVAASLLGRMAPGERVVICLPTGPDFVRVLLGCLYAGIVPCAVATPNTGIRADPEAKGMREWSAVLSTLRPSLVVVVDSEASAAQEVLSVEVLTPRDLAAAMPMSTRDLPPVGTEQVHHIQLTSGSTSLPKAAMLTWSNVQTNIAALTGAVGFDPGRDQLLSWLPLHHDMGLIQLLTSLSTGNQMSLMQPMAFLRDPLGWLRNITAAGATLSAAPPFALRACVSRYSASRAEGINLGAWRRLFVGAEPVHAQLLEDFTAKFAPHGLRRDVVYPCYGMAETVLSATLVPTQVQEGVWKGGWVHTQRVDSEILRVDRKAVPSGAGDATTLVSMGSPIPGLELSIRDDDHTLGDGEVGEICLRGPSLMGGYDGIPRLSTLDPAGWFRTGDQGYSDAGHLYVLGRIKEVIIVRGRNYAPHAVEDVIERQGARGSSGRALVFAAPIGKDGLDEVIAIVETRVPEAEHEDLRTNLAAAVRDEFGFNLSDIVFVSPGGLHTTTSGKKQRLRARGDYLHNQRVLAALDTAQASPVGTSVSEGSS